MSFFAPHLDPFLGAKQHCISLLKCRAFNITKILAAYRAIWSNEKLPSFSSSTRKTNVKTIEFNYRRSLSLSRSFSQVE